MLIVNLLIVKFAIFPLMTEARLLSDKQPFLTIISLSLFYKYSTCILCVFLPQRNTTSSDKSDKGQTATNVINGIGGHRQAVIAILALGSSSVGYRLYLYTRSGQVGWHARTS